MEPCRARQGSPTVYLIALDAGFAFREFRLKPSGAFLGRDAAQCSIIASGPTVSRRHARITADSQGRYHLEDLDSTNGVYCNGERAGGITALNNGDIIGLGTPNGHLRFQESSSLATSLSTCTAKARWVIGRAQDCDIPLPFEPTVSARHAVITISQGQLLINDNHSLNGTWVNGRAITEHALAPGDTVVIGSTRFHFQLDQTGCLLVRRKECGQSIKLECQGLGRTLPARKGRGRDLLHDISLVVEPGELVGILGPSGSGKTTLLTALNGSTPIERGTILYNEVPLTVSLGKYRNEIGYVPQDDILHPELTVEQSLGYTAQLRLPGDLTTAQRHTLVDSIIDTMGLAAVRACPIHQLSGGQRKRVSIGAELIVRPGILFLDEPTAGLDPGVEDRLMRHFRSMANHGTTVIITTHILTHFNLLDKVVILTEGQLAFFGTPQEAVDFFRQGRDDHPDPAWIFEALAGADNAPLTDTPGCPHERRTTIAQRYAAAYRQSEPYRQHVEARFSPALHHKQDEPVSNDATLPEVHGQSDPSLAAPSPVEPRAFSQPLRETWRSWLILSRRHGHIRCAAFKRLLFFLCVPVVLALVTLSQPIKGIPSEALALQEKKAISAAIARGGSFMESQVKTLLAPAGVYDQRTGADLVYALRHEGAVNLPVPMGVLLMMVMTALFSGTLIACLEISAERSIYRRERLSFLGVLPYLGSKLPFCLAVTGLQCLAFLLICWSNPQLAQLPFLPAFLTMTVVAWSSIPLGLLLSALDPTAGRFSIILALAVVLPQFILSGGLGPGFYAGMPPGVRFAADVLAARWGLEMTCTALFSRLQSAATAWIPGFIREGIGFDFGTPVYYSGLGALLIQSLFWLFLCTWFLRRQDRR